MLGLEELLHLLKSGVLRNVEPLKSGVLTECGAIEERCLSECGVMQLGSSPTLQSDIKPTFSGLIFFRPSNQQEIRSLPEALLLPVAEFTP
jgi:hypothetical protein